MVIRARSDEAMAFETSGLHLLALNLQRPTAIQTAVYGNFSGPKSQEFVVSRGHSLELFRPDENGRLVSICYTNLFANIRSLIPFRMAGAATDYLVIGSDAGTLTVCEFDNSQNDWKTVHSEIFGKTGCRRIVPGQYLACDPKGRAIMIAGIEKQKYVYIMNRDSANRLTISSPLEAHKSETILYAMCGVDVGFNNPIFALIEMEYTEADQDPSGQAALETEKKLTFYELDLGLNHVVRKWSEPISRTANMLFPVPGGGDGPSGVLVCGENWISYKNQGHIEVRTPIPRRRDLPTQRGVLITCGVLHKVKERFFYLLQSEYGDVYKVTMDVDSTNVNLVVNLIVTHFDSLPGANSICITKTGFLFAASEFGNHGLYQFQALGDDPNAVRAEKVPDEMNEELGDDAESAVKVAPTFLPSSKLRNLLLTDDVGSFAPVTDLLVGDLAGEQNPQIHLLCGRGNRSQLKILRHGVAVTEVAVSELPGRPNAVWTVRAAQHSEFDRYIIVSFNNATLVLSIGDNVEEVTDSGFNDKVPTLQVVLLADNAMLQIHATGIRHIRENGTKSEWKTPGRKPIERASANPRQVAISLQGGEVIYFELDATGSLMEMANHDMGREVSSLDVGEIPAGRLKSPFLAVGCWDDTVQVLSLEPSNLLTQLSVKSLPSRPDSVCQARMERERGGAGGSEAVPILYLNVGLQSGVLVRLAVDAVTGALSDMRQRYLGTKSVKLFRVMVRGQRGVLALSSRAWLLYNYQGRYHQTPLSYETLEYASNFASELCPEGIVAVASNTLRIVTVDTLGEIFNQQNISLKYTPRRMCLVADNSLAIVEADHNELSEPERALIAQTSQVNNDDAQMEGTDGELSQTSVAIRGPVPANEGRWASCIRVVHPLTGAVQELLELSNNEAAFSLATCRFATHPSETFVVVGTAQDLTLHPRKSRNNFVHVYRLLEGRLHLVHSTELEDVPLALCEFNGRLLVGAGRSLKLYELGKRKLLKKAENRQFPSAIVRLQSSGDRVYVSDMCESIHLVKYKRQENVLGIFADDTYPRC